MLTPQQIAGLDLIAPSSPSLNEVSEPVSIAAITHPDIQAFIDRMYVIAQGQQGDPERPTMVGLAAPQIGVNRRIILVGVDAQGNGEAPQLEALINPVITAASAHAVEGREGCYSASRVCGIVTRAQSVSVRAYDRYGKQVHYEAEGFPARIFQHEIDHLDGIRFPDHITNPAHLHWVPVEQFGDYRKHWSSWQKLCPPERWLAVKAGLDSSIV